MKELFDIPLDVHYLNHAFMAPMLLEQKRAIEEDGLPRCLRPWSIDFPGDFMEPVEEVRGLFGRLIGAPAACVALTSSASYGLATVCHHLLRRGRHERVLMVRDEFLSNVVQWRRLLPEARTELLVVDRGASSAAAFVALLDLHAPTCVTIAPCHWMDGRLYPLREIGEWCQRHGALFVVDATQWVGSCPLDVQDLGVDFLVAAGYKSLLAPYGNASFLYVRKELIEEVTPMEFNGFNLRRQGSSAEGAYAPLDAELLDGARRFDVGERMNFLSLPAVRAGLRFLLDHDVRAHVEPLLDEFCRSCEAFGMKVLPKTARAPHMTGVRFAAPLAPPALQDLRRELQERKIFVSVRGDAVRVSPHLYSTAEDLQMLVDFLASKLSSADFSGREKS